MLKNINKEIIKLINRINISYPTYYYLPTSSDRIYEECSCVSGAKCQQICSPNRKYPIKNNHYDTNPGGGG
jgi:hypothetical protein